MLVNWGQFSQRSSIFKPTIDDGKQEGTWNLPHPSTYNVGDSTPCYFLISTRPLKNRHIDFGPKMLSTTGMDEHCNTHKSAVNSSSSRCTYWMFVCKTSFLKVLAGCLLCKCFLNACLCFCSSLYNM